jgi:hypothetical protein
MIGWTRQAPISFIKLHHTHPRRSAAVRIIGFRTIAAPFGL